MNDAQITSLAITLFAIAAGSIFNNVRISDLATLLNKRIDDTNLRMSDRFDALNSKIDRMENTILAVVGDHEQRIRGIEKKVS